MQNTNSKVSLFASKVGAFSAAPLALLLGTAMIAAPQAQAADKQVKSVSQPEISMMLEPYTPGGQMRTYQVPSGTSYWTNDLPIYKGDNVKLDVFVATGVDDLQELKVRVDNVQVADLTKAPWTATLNTNTLSSGYHFVEAWCQVSGPKAQFKSRTLTFFVSPATPPATDAAANTKVKGNEQILQNGQIVNVPLENSAASNQVPALPSVLANAQQDDQAKATIVLKDPTTDQVVTTSTESPLSAPAVATIVPTPGSTAQRFDYVLTRNGEAIIAPGQLFAVDATRIRLQPRTSTAPGLLPGTTTLWVWPVDAQGNYGTPVSMQVEVGSPTQG